ncbi:hypothetical protein ACE1CI_16975 [Aerosakkonemataceae cyanobacterium BLCC-F50]|uniref:DUF5615 domain-containing protein n=1 Tax=Floridaenema flaviceps BLCC-F50 TaxID=3153642 RepID=A0ABV4XUI7_9CYAN
MICYLMDENVNPLYQIQLQRRDPDLVVWAVGDEGTPSKGTLDPEILIWCEEYGFILVTNNRTSMPVHLTDHINQGRHVPGIFILNPNMSIGETIEELILIAGTSDDDEYQDTIRFLPITQ